VSHCYIFDYQVNKLTERSIANQQTYLKGVRLEMLAWHAASRGNSDRETQQFHCLSPTSDDILKWWRQQTATFMKLPAWQHHFWLC